MNLYLIRHGIAEEPGGGPDSKRELTEEGREKTATIARRIARVFPAPDLIVSSPYLRAQQTADFFQKAWGVTERVHSENLIPMADPAVFLRWLEKCGREAVAAVAHEPLLSLMAGKILTGRDGISMVEFKKAAVARFEFEPRDGLGILRALVPPRAVLD